MGNKLYLLQQDKIVASTIEPVVIHKSIKANFKF